jgi:hypothetical protein
MLSTITRPTLFLRHLALLQGMALLLLFSACGGADNSPTPPEDSALSTDLIANPKTASPELASSTAAAGSPVMQFDRDKWDFGEIIQGESVEYNFRFTNTGDAPLIITDAKGSCGCTVPDWPKEPIGPGESGRIRVTYDSKGRKDQFNKTVTITANTVPNANKLFISGVVIVPQGNA